MIKVEPIKKILKCVLASGKLSDEKKPLSAIFIAPIECGKTSIIRRYCLKAQNVFYTTDATAHGIIQDTNQLKDFKTGGLTHIVIPDLLMCIGRKTYTVKTFIHFMNALIEEGIVNISTYATHLKGKVETRAGLITAIPPDSFRDKRHQWGKIGFLSRALPLSYDYTLITQAKILDFIEKQEHLENEILKIKLPEEPHVIELPFKLAKKIEPHAKSLAAAHSEYQKVYGFRYQRQLQTLAKAIALLGDKDEVDEECLDELEELLNYINFEFNKI